MTLQASGPISFSDVLGELRIANPGRASAISLNDSDVRALAGKPSGSISLSDLYGKSSFTATGHDATGSGISSTSGGTISVSPYVTVIGGSNVTYQWSITASNISVTLGNANSSYCTVSRSYAKLSDGFFNVTLQCVVTNGNGASITISGINAYGEWSSYR